MKMIPLSVPNLKGNELKYVSQAIKDTWVSTGGPFVKQFEDKVAGYVHSKYAVACQNGTSGLHISLILSDVKPGDEVIVPTLTFISPVNTIRYVNAQPVFMDCDEYLNIDAEKTEEFIKKECILTKKGLKNKRSGRLIKAIIPVHIFGSISNMERIMQIAKKYHLKVIEDATESLGSYFITGRYKNNFSGTIGNLGVYSFNGNKIITTGGGGMIVTNNKKLAQKAKYLTTQAKDDHIRYIHNEIGYNYRMTNVQAAIGLAQLEKIENFIQTKKKNYELYKNKLAKIDGLSLLDFPTNIRPNYWLYSLLIDKKKFGMDRDALMKNLEKNNIESRPIWYLNHWQKPYKKNQSYKIEKAIWYWEHVLNIPSSSNLTETELNRVVKTIEKARD